MNTLANESQSSDKQILNFLKKSNPQFFDDNGVLKKALPMGMLLELNGLLEWKNTLNLESAFAQNDQDKKFFEEVISKLCVQTIQYFDKKDSFRSLLCQLDEILKMKEDVYNNYCLTEDDFFENFSFYKVSQKFDAEKMDFSEFHKKIKSKFARSIKFHNVQTNAIHQILERQKEHFLKWTNIYNEEGMQNLQEPREVNTKEHFKTLIERNTVIQRIVTKIQESTINITTILGDRIEGLTAAEVREVSV